eukprot:2804044-Prymnesium_polylepis.1
MYSPASTCTAVHQRAHAGLPRPQLVTASDLTGPLANRSLHRRREPLGFLDVGANIGYYTLLFAAAGYNVISVEPIAHNRAAIKTTLCLNLALRQHVRIAPYALVSPDTPRGMRCHVRSDPSEDNIGNGVMFCDGPCPEEEEEAADVECDNVETRTLDGVLSHLRPPRVKEATLRTWAPFDWSDQNPPAATVSGCPALPLLPGAAWTSRVTSATHLQEGHSCSSRSTRGLLAIETTYEKSWRCVHEAARRHEFNTSLWETNTILRRPPRRKQALKQGRVWAPSMPVVARVGLNRAGEATVTGLPLVSSVLHVQASRSAVYRGVDEETL